MLILVSPLWGDGRGAAQPTIQWQNTIGGSGFDRLFSIQQTSDGGYVLGGFSDSDSTGDKTDTSRGFADYWVLKLDTSGAIQWQNTIGGNSSDFLNSILLSLLPIAELRGGIPYAILKDIHPLVAYFVCCLSNILVYPIVLIFLEYFHKHFLKIKYYQYLFDKFVERTRKKTQKKIEKWGFWGIMVFVMIPLPVTGAYTGSFAAWIFNINKRKSFFAVSLGVFIAGIIVTAIVLTGAKSFEFLINYHFVK